MAIEGVFRGFAYTIHAAGTAYNPKGCHIMDSGLCGWRVTVAHIGIIAAMIVLSAGSVFAADLDLTFIGSAQVSLTRTAYHYELSVSDPAILHQDQSGLVLRDMAGVVAQGDAYGWSNGGITSTTSSYLYTGIDITDDGIDDNADSVGVTNFATFDVIVTTEGTTIGEIEYEVEADEGKVDTVPGPVATDPPELYDISGTVYLDNDESGGLYDNTTDDILTGVAVELRDASGNVLRTTLSNHRITNGSNEFIGNYNFADIEPGDYTVVVPDQVTGADGELIPTTVTEQSVSLVDSTVREVDFGYAPEPLYTISGTTFVDYDRDGVWDQPDEEALEDVGLIQLVDGGGNVVADTFSTFQAIEDGDGTYLGNYIFTDVPAGSYTVVAPETAGELGTLEITGVSERSADVVGTRITGIDFGYLNPDYNAPADVKVEAYVFFDYDQDGEMDEFEMPFDGITVTLSGDADQTEITDGDGFVDFGQQANGDYTMAVTDGGAYGLLQYWNTTTADSYSFTIDSDTESPVVRYFGYYPDPDPVIEDMHNCEITGDNHTIGFWMHNVTFAIHGRSHGVQVPRDELLGYLDEVESYGAYDDPFVLSPRQLQTALWYLHPGLSGNSPVQKLERQLLAAELNQVSGFNSSMPELEEAILFYAEWVSNQDNVEVAGSLASFIDAWNNLGNIDCDETEEAASTEDGEDQQQDGGEDNGDGGSTADDGGEDGNSRWRRESSPNRGWDRNRDTGCEGNHRCR